MLPGSRLCGLEPPERPKQRWLACLRHCLPLRVAKSRWSIMEHPTFPCLLLTLLFVMTGKPNLVATGAGMSLGLGLAASLLAIPL
jgi:hypothetical protein